MTADERNTGFDGLPWEDTPDPADRLSPWRAVVKVAAFVAVIGCANAAVWTDGHTWQWAVSAVIALIVGTAALVMVEQEIEAIRARHGLPDSRDKPRDGGEAPKEEP